MKQYLVPVILLFVLAALGVQLVRSGLKKARAASVGQNIATFLRDVLLGGPFGDPWGESGIANLLWGFALILLGILTLLLGNWSS